MNPQALSSRLETLGLEVAGWLLSQSLRPKSLLGQGSVGGDGVLIRPGAPWPWHSRRRLSPLRRREGPRPLPATSPPRQKVPRFTVFCALPIFSHFSDLVV